MTDLRIAAAEGMEVSPLDAIIKAYRYNDYRRYPSVSGKAGVKYLRGVTMEGLARDGAEGWFAYLGDVPVGFAAVSPLDWESDYFGLRMARLSVIVAEEHSAPVFSVADELLSTALGAASRKGFQHLSLRVDVEEIGLVHALEEHGFRLMDTIVAYAFHMRRNHLPEIRPKYDLRLYRPEDYDVVLDIAATCFKGYPNRFLVDPHIPQKPAQAFYREWTVNCCQGDLADEMIVAEKKGRVIGFLAYRCNPQLERHTGVRVMGSGLGGCYPIRFNAYLDLIQEATRRVLPIVHAIDLETQAFNIATVNYYQKLNYSYVRAKHSFHLWLKD